MSTTHASRLATGDIDLSFGENGYLMLPQLGELRIRTPFVHALPNGNLLVAAQTSIANGTSSFALFKFTTDGQPASDFGNGDGYVLGNYPFMEYSEGQALTVQSAGGAGKILMLGCARNNKHDQLDILMLSRFHADGILDTSFGSSGHVDLFPFKHLWTAYTFNSGSVTQAQDRIYVSGTFHSIDFPEEHRGIVFCLNLDGSLDFTFNGTGYLEIGAHGIPTTIKALAIQPSGALVAVGSMRTVSGLHGLFATILPDGQLDTSFGDAGSGLLLFQAIGLDSTLNTLVIDDEQRLVGMGLVREASPTSTLAMVYRVTCDGLPDLSFNHGNPVLTTLPASILGWQAGTITPLGQLFALGSGKVSDGINSQLVIARYRADGTLDGSFGSGGFVTHNLSPEAHLFLVQQPNTNRLIAAMDQPGLLGRRALLLGLHGTAE